MDTVFIILFCTLCRLHVVTGCDSMDVPGCNITNGSARCASVKIAPVLRLLPSCVTQLHITPKPGNRHNESLSFTAKDNSYSLEELRIESGFQTKFSCLLLPLL